MPRQSKPAELSLQATGSTHNAPNNSSINIEGVDLDSFGGGFEHNIAAGLTPLPKDLPLSPVSPQAPHSSASREPSKSFLSSLKNRVASEQEQKKDKDTRQAKDREDDYRPNTSSMSKIYHLRNNPGSTPELSLVGSNENVRKDSIEDEKPALPVRPQPNSQASEESTTSRRKDKSFRIGMTRSKSTRRDSHSKSRPMNGKDSFEGPPATAPLQSDWPGSDARVIGKGKEKDRRGKSAERAPSHYDSEENLSMSYPKSSKDKGGFKAGSKNVMSKAKSGGGNFLNRLGKIGRTTSSNEKDVPDAEYTMKVINLPLVEQTRITRISKQLSGCRDKTEYWMPSLPWRCIDFLNTNAEEEGLYRIPGSGPKVKHWQRRFDSELDIDLLSEEVTDTNEIASMLKAWLRELPSEMMPANLQKSLAIQLEKENPNYKNVGQPASQLLRDCLSDLPPYNYYLLFAITCHLSLLLTNKDINKMDLNNLAVCVGPCLNLDRWLFNYLVGDWRHCWQGCYTEKDFLKIEEMVEAGVDPSSIDSDQLTIGEFSDEKSLNQSIRTNTLSDDRSTGRSEWATTTGGNSDAGSTHDSRAKSSGSGDAKSMSSDLYSSRRVENYQPLTYTPAGYSNGSYGLGIEPDTKRPSTAEQRRTPEEGTIKGNGGAKSRSDSTTPRVGHTRSRSDLPPTPVDGGDFGFFNNR